MHKAGRRRAKQAKLVPTEVEEPQPPFISDEDLGVCCGCYYHRCHGPYEKDDNGMVKVRCTAVEQITGDKMVLARSEIASREKCEYANHVNLRHSK